MGEMVVCLGCRTVVWAYDHEPQDVRAIANHLQLPCPNCCEIGNFDGWQSSDWQEMHAIADREGFVWQPDGECRWFGATSVVKAMKEALEGALPYLRHSLKFYRFQREGHEFWPNREAAEANIRDAEAALAKVKGCADAILR